LRTASKGNHIQLVDEVYDKAKAEFLAQRRRPSPIDWPEPFGLVMIEAMACGTPVIAFGRWSVPEILEDGVSGFIHNESQAVSAVERLPEIGQTQRLCHFGRRFTARRMAEDYVRCYRRLIETAPNQERAQLALR
jgi:glycosyltransferase involved in cell wall biosynthesis